MDFDETFLISEFQTPTNGEYFTSERVSDENLTQNGGHEGVAAVDDPPTVNDPEVAFFEENLHGELGGSHGPEEVAAVGVALDQIQQTGSKAIGLQLPVARVKRLAKSEGTIHYLSAEAGVLITKAGELFLEAFASLTRKKLIAENRSTVLYKDLSSAVVENDKLVFLGDIIPEKVKPSLDALKRSVQEPHEAPPSPRKKQKAHS